MKSTEIKIGGIYSYVNEYNYVFIARVTRVTDKSVFTNSLLDSGVFSTQETRRSLKQFSKYRLQESLQNLIH